MTKYFASFMALFGEMAEISTPERFYLERFLTAKKDLYFIKFQTPFSTVGSFSEASLRGCHHKIQFHNSDVAFDVSKLKGLITQRIKMAPRTRIVIIGTLLLSQLGLLAALNFQLFWMVTAY